MNLDWLPQPAVIGHRGASAHAPENTLPAFELAVEMGADAIEFDVMLTRDEQVVVIHDPQLDRTTTGTGRVPALTAAEVRRWTAAGSFQDAYPEASVPLLEEVLDLYGSRIPLNIELKNLHAPADRLPARVAELVAASSDSDRILFSSFNPLALLHIRRLCPDRPVALLASPGLAGAWARSGLGNMIPHQAIHPYLRDVTRTLIRKAHKQGRRVHTYTVNQAADIRQMADMGVDGIFTDDPAGARAILTGTSTAAT